MLWDECGRHDIALMKAEERTILYHIVPYLFVILHSIPHQIMKSWSDILPCHVFSPQKLQSEVYS